MQRFFTNRLWTFILALTLCLGGTAVLSGTTAHAADSPAISDDPLQGGGPGAGYGDPDAPSGDSKRAQLRGGVVVPRGSAVIAGDDLELQGAWMWRLRLALQSLRGYWIHP